MRIGLTSGCLIPAFWQEHFPQVEWIEGPVADLIEQKANGIFVDAASSDLILQDFHEMSQVVKEAGFVDFLEVLASGEVLAKAWTRTVGQEILVRGGRTLDLKRRAYLVGHGAWTRIFSLIAVEAGYQKLTILVDDIQEAVPLVKQLSRFCFGVDFQTLAHGDLILQPNDGSLLVNTLEADANPGTIADLAYLNYLSPDGLVLDTGKLLQDHDLLVEARALGLAILDSNLIRGLTEHKILESLLGADQMPMTLNDYLEKRKKFIQGTNSPLVQ